MTAVFIHLFLGWSIVPIHRNKPNITYRKTSSISRSKAQNLNVSHLVLQLSLPNSLKPNVKLRMKM